MKLPVSMVFISVVMLFFLLYMFVRFVKRRNYNLIAIFVLQMIVFSMAVSTIIDDVYTTWWVELVYIVCGVLLPCVVLVMDYLTLVGRLKKKESFNGFIEKIPYSRSTRVNIDKFKLDFGCICPMIEPEQLMNYVLISDKNIAENLKKILKKSDEYYRISHYDKACSDYQFLSTLFCENPYIQYNHANIAFKLGDYKRSIELYKMALSLFDNELNIEDISEKQDLTIIDSRLIEGHNEDDDLDETDHKTFINNITRSRDKKDKALTIRFSAHTFESMIRYNLALSYQKYGQNETAFRQLERILKKQTGFANTEQNYAKLCISFGYQKRGIKYLKKVAELNGYNVELLFVLGRINYDLGNYEECISFLIKGLEVEAVNADIISLLSRVYRKVGKNELSIEYGQRLLQIAEPIEDSDYLSNESEVSTLQEAYYSMGKAYFKLDMLEDAEKCYLKALEKATDSWEILYDLGVVYDANGSYTKALKTFESVLQIKNDFPDAYNQMIIILAGRKRLKEAVNVFNLAVKYCPDAYTLHFNIGNVLMQLNRVTEAIEAYKNALSIEQNDGEVYLYLSSAYIAKHQYDRAIQVYKRGLKRNENDSEIYFGLARVYGLMNDKETSLEMLKKAISFDESIKNRARNLTDFVQFWDTDEFNSVVNQ